MYACEIAHRLIKQGEAIAVLIILDMRVPSLTPINIVTHGFVDKTRAFKCINRVRDLAEDQSFRERAHLVAAPPCPAIPADKPRHVVVWARQSLNRTEDAPIAAMGRPGPDIGKPLDEMTPVDFERYFKSWFYGRREHFGTNGWEAILGDHILVHCVEGGWFLVRPDEELSANIKIADHFSVVANQYQTAPRVTFLHLKFQTIQFCPAWNTERQDGRWKTKGH
ncbi:Orsellinic acid synthase [Metarhizium anisopliae]|nr:Orsellinic acid synthase [Metarhizium anisopliae]